MLRVSIVTQFSIVYMDFLSLHVLTFIKLFTEWWMVTGMISIIVTVIFFLRAFPHAPIDDQFSYCRQSYTWKLFASLFSSIWWWKLISDWCMQENRKNNIQLQQSLKSLCVLPLLLGFLSFIDVTFFAVNMSFQYLFCRLSHHWCKIVCNLNDTVKFHICTRSFMQNWES